MGTTSSRLAPTLAADGSPNGVLPLHAAPLRGVTGNPRAHPEGLSDPAQAPSLALFRCLLAKDLDGAAQLLADAPAGSLTLEGPQGFTALHAAIGAGAAAAGLLPTLVAAGVPLNKPLEDPDGEVTWRDEENRLPDSVHAFMRSCGLQCIFYEQFGRLEIGMTPLGFAAAQAARDGGACALKLLSLGADVNAGCPSPLAALLKHHNIVHGDANEALAAELLRRGADCLAPASRFKKAGMLAATPPRRLPDFLFAHVELQLRAGQLQLGDVMAAAGVLQLAAQRRHHRLLWHGVEWLRSHAASSAAAMAGLEEDDQWALGNIVGSLAADRWVDEAALMALLSWQLPIDLQGQEDLLLEALMKGRRSAAMLRTLCGLGAPLSMCALLTVCGRLQVDALEGLLGTPAVDTSAAVRRSLAGREWACPFHQVLAGLTDTGNDWDDLPAFGHAGAARHAAAQAALQCMQLLHAAGYAPSVYRNVRVADTRGALGHLQGLPEVLAELDPIDEQLNLFPDWVKQTSAYRVARWLRHPVEWTPERHHEWPPAFKAAARTLLVASSRDSEEGLALLPSNVVLKVIGLAGRDLVAWLRE